MKKIIAIVLTLCIALTTCFAGGSQETAPSAQKAKEYKDRVVIVNALTLQKLDPQNNNTAINGQFYQLTHNTLIDCNYDTNEFLPELAKSWEVSNDGLLYTFNLRNDVKFYDGTPFTAKDVKYTFDRAASTSSQKSKLAFVKECKIVDDYTIQFVMTATDAEFLDNLCVPNLSIICEASGAGENDWGYQNGTGAWHLKDWLPGNYTLLSRNDNYWGEVPKTKEIYYQLIGEASARAIALETGDADICIDVPPIEAANIENYNCELISFPSAKLVYIALNNSGYVEAFKNADVRKAFNYATDQNTIITLLREGYATTIKGVVPSAVAYSSEAKISGYSYDPTKAKELLAKAGYPNGLTVALYYDDNLYPGLFECLQSMWAKSGIKLELGTTDSSILQGRIKAKDFDVTVQKWSFSTIAYSLGSLWSSTSGSNKTLTADSYIDDLLTKSQSELDPTKRAALYDELQMYLSEVAALIPMYVDTCLNGIRKGVEGAKFYSNEKYDLTYVTATK